MTIRFLLICEGSSDTALVSHIQALLIDCGASEAWCGAGQDDGGMATR